MIKQFNMLIDGVNVILLQNYNRTTGNNISAGKLARALTGDMSFPFAL